MPAQGAEWWGGRLADGSLIVLSPSGDALLTGDSSSPTGLQPKPRREKARSLKTWTGVRTGVPFPYGRDGHSIGIRRGTLALTLPLLIGGALALRWLIEARLGLSPSSVAGGLLSLATAALFCALLLALIYSIEVLPMKRRGVRFVSVPDDDDDYLRYVHSKVADAPQWATLEDAARRYSPPAGGAAEVHALMWEAAGIKPTLDASEILAEDIARLDEMALQARDL